MSSDSAAPEPGPDPRADAFGEAGAWLDGTTVPALLLTAGVAGLGGLGLLIGAEDRTGPWFAAALASWTVLCGLLLFVPVHALLRREVDWFSPAFVVIAWAAAEFLQRGAVLIVAPHTFRFPTLIDPLALKQNLTLALLAGVAAYASWLAGYFAWQTRARQPRSAALTPIQRRLLLGAGLLMLVAAYAMYASFLESVGGLGGLLSNLFRRVELLEGRHYELAVIRMVYVAPLLLFVLAARARHRPRFPILPALLIVIGCVVLATFGGRGRALMPLLMLLALSHYVVRPVKLRALALVMIPAVLAANLILELRVRSGQVNGPGELWSVVSERFGATGISEQLSMFLTQRVPFQALDGIIVIIGRDDLPRQIDLPLRAAVVVIPRGLWPNKPTGNPGTIFSAHWLPVNPSAKSTGAVGTAYMMYGLAGVVVLFFLNGRIWRWLYEHFRAGPGRPIFAVGYVLVLVSSIDLLIPPYENLFVHIVPLAALAVALRMTQGLVESLRSEDWLGVDDAPAGSDER